MAISFHSSWAKISQPKIGCHGGRCVFDFIRTCQTICQSGCTMGHALQREFQLLYTQWPRLNKHRSRCIIADLVNDGESASQMAAGVGEQARWAINPRLAGFCRALLPPAPSGPGAKQLLIWAPKSIGRTDAEAEAPILWPPDMKSSLEKTLMLGKIEGGRRRGWQGIRWLDGITDSMGLSLSKLWVIVKDRVAGVLQPMGPQRVGYDWMTEQQPKSITGLYPVVVTFLSWQWWPVLLENLRVQGLPLGGHRWEWNIKELALSDLQMYLVGTVCQWTREALNPCFFCYKDYSFWISTSRHRQELPSLGSDRCSVTLGKSTQLAEPQFAHL